LIGGAVMKNNIEGNALERDLIELIDEKAAYECADTALLFSSSYIKQLNEHISGVHSLTNKEIANKVSYLVGCLTITLDTAMPGLEFLRARLCEEGQFEYAHELSYIKDTTASFPKVGRLNQAGQSIFYAAIMRKKGDTALEVVLSEAGAKDLDNLNIICSYQKANCDLNLRIIGIWDQVRRNERPYYLSEAIFDYYKKAKEYMGKQFDSNLLMAYELTDRFFADLLSRKGSEPLYQVTSAISSVFLSGSTCEGVLYSSVEAKGEPVVALKPQAVDDKLEHQWVRDVTVEKCFGYEFFQYKTQAKTSEIDSEDGKLVW